jgi:hypothetical protein
VLCCPYCRRLSRFFLALTHKHCLSVDCHPLPYRLSQSKSKSLILYVFRIPRSLLSTSTPANVSAVTICRASARSPRATYDGWPLTYLFGCLGLGLDLDLDLQLGPHTSLPFTLSPSTLFPGLTHCLSGCTLLTPNGNPLSLTLSPYLLSSTFCPLFLAHLAPFSCPQTIASSLLTFIDNLAHPSLTCTVRSSVGLSLAWF